MKEPLFYFVKEHSGTPYCGWQLCIFRFVFKWHKYPRCSNFQYCRYGNFAQIIWRNQSIEWSMPQINHDKLPVICRLFGHNPHVYTDSGFRVCKRCNAHEYWDDGQIGISNRWNEAGIVLIPFRVARWWVSHAVFFCKLKVKDWYWRLYNGKDDLPF